MASFERMPSELNGCISCSEPPHQCDSAPVSTRFALVTAGAQGLGAALSETLLEEGYHVFAHYFRTREGAERLMEAGARRGLRVIPLQGDLRDPAARGAMMRAVEGETGHLEVLVHNLGVYPEVGLLETSLELWQETLELTCTTAFDLTQRALPLLRSAVAPARVITIGDSGADRIEARAFSTPYHIAKLGLHVLTRSYAQLLMKDGITVNMISPGYLENSVGDPGELPAGRPGRFEDITGAMRWLLSEGAGHVSGTNVLVSGAWNLG